MKNLFARACVKKTQQFIGKLLVFVMTVGLMSTTQVAEVSAEAASTTYEAEDGSVCDSSTARKIHTGTSNASGGKSATLYKGEYITYTVTAEESGNYDVTVRYAGASIGSATTSTTIPLEITVSGGDAAVHNVDYPNNYNTFREYEFAMELTEGANIIVIKNVIENNAGSDVFANIDYITVSKSVEEDIEEEKTPISITCEAEDSTVCDSSTARKIHTGTSNASGGKSATLYKGEYITYTVSVEEAGTYNVLMRYAGNANPAGSKPETVPLEVKVGDGAAEVHNVDWPADYNTFWDYKFDVDLVSGDNTIVIKNASDDSTIFANIDYIIISNGVEEDVEEEEKEPGEEVTTTYEAEDSTVCTFTKVNTEKTGRIRTDLSNASGKTAAVMYPTDYITYTVDVEEAGTCDLIIRYAVGSYPAGTVPENVPLEVKVGNKAATVEKLDWYGDAYNTFYEYKFSAELAAGENTIVITNESDLTPIFVNIDYITVVENPQPEEENPVIPAVGSMEAEDTEWKGASIGTNGVFSGGKYLEAMNANVNNDMSKVNKYLTYKVDADEAGYYKVILDYATESSLTKFAVKVNDGDWMFRYVESTGAWNKLGTEEYVIELQEGINTITVTGSLDTGWIILDKFTMEKTTEVPSVDPLAPIESHEPEAGEVKKTAKELQEEELVSFRGRNMNVGDSVSFDYSASGFEFNFEGEGDIRANFTVTAGEKFAVDVDGTVTYHSVVAGDVSVFLAEDLEAGTHTIKLYKTQEAMTGLAQLNYMTYDEDAVLTPVETDYNFLIIGASSTAGNQIDPVSGAEDGYLSFSSLVSRAYNATWQQVSCSGRGVVQGTRGENGWAFSQEGMLAEMYRAQSWFRDKETEYDPTSFTPDVIITNFNNDFSGGTRAQGYDYDEIYEKMFEFVSELRASYPNAYIALTYGNFPTFEADGTYNSPTVIAGYYAAVDAYRETTGDNMVEYVELPCLAGGKSNHSNWEEHEYIAELLSDRISKALDIENPLPITHFEIEDGELVNAGDTGKVNSILDWTSSVSKHSGNSYVDGMNVDLAGEAIATDGSNVKYVSVPITVAKTGIYKIEVNYGTDQTPVIYVRANGDEWKALTLASTTDWNKIGQNAEYSVMLTAGENVIDVTGATNSSYVCLDRIDTILVRGESEAEIALRENRVALQEAIVNADALSAEEYTTDSWANFNDALNIAKDVLNNSAASLEVVERALNELQSAQENLEKVSIPPVETPDEDDKQESDKDSAQEDDKQESDKHNDKNNKQDDADDNHNVSNSTNTSTVGGNAAPSVTVNVNNNEAETNVETNVETEVADVEATEVETESVETEEAEIDDNNANTTTDDVEGSIEIEDEEVATTVSVSEKRSHNYLWIVCALVLGVGAIAGAGIYFMKKKNEEN